MELLEQIRIYSCCTYISDLKYTSRWMIGIRRIFYDDGIRKYSLWEWKDTFDYLQGKDVCIADYNDIVLHIKTILDG